MSKQTKKTTKKYVYCYFPKILWRCSVRLPDWRSGSIDSIDFSTFVHGYRCLKSNIDLLVTFHIFSNQLLSDLFFQEIVLIVTVSAPTSCLLTFTKPILPEYRKLLEMQKRLSHNIGKYMNRTFNQTCI